jgi:hypothetical protein
MNEADEPREANDFHGISAGSDITARGMSALNMDNSDSAFQNLHSLHSLFALFKKVDDRESLYGWIAWTQSEELSSDFWRGTEQCF